MTVNKIRYLGLLPQLTTQVIKDKVIGDLPDGMEPKLYTYKLNQKRFDIWRHNPPITADVHMCTSSEELLQIVLMLNLGIPIEELIND